MKVKINNDIDDLFCCHCKSRINIGEKYIEISENYFDEKIIKEYHCSCVPEMEDDE